MKIQILTVAGQPRVEVDVWEAKDIDRIVRLMYGLQPNGCPHDWRGLADHQEEGG